MIHITCDSLLQYNYCSPSEPHHSCPPCTMLQLALRSLGSGEERLGKDEGKRVTDGGMKGRDNNEGEGAKDEGKEWMFCLPVMVHT